MKKSNELSSLLAKSGFVAIQNPLLVSRYNECLEALGFAPTALTEFYIDGKGWSPEIAEEKGNPFYLSHGSSAQCGIILCPDQKGKPVFRPRFSFESLVLERIFKDSSRAIADLTSKAGIWFQIDPGVTQLVSPEDLLLIESVNVNVGDTAGIMTAARKQRSLVDRFRKEPMAWARAELRQDIISSASTSGDLRFREVIIEPFRVEGIDCMFAELFGGTFVFRCAGKQQHLIVVSDDFPKPEFCIKRAYHVSDETLLKRLFDLELVTVPTKWYRDNPICLCDLLETILVDVLYKHNPDNGFDISKLNQAQKKRYAIDHMDKLPEEFSELEKYLKRLESSGEPRLSKELRLMVMRPHEKLSAHAVRVVWHLISKMTIVSVNDLFENDEPTFFARFPDWPESRKMWAIEHLKQRGLVPRKE